MKDEKGKRGQRKIVAEGGFQAEGSAVAKGGAPHDPAAKAPPNTEQLFDAANIELQRRMRFNPLRMLDPERLSLALDNFQIGILRDAALLWEAMVQRDDTLITVKNHLEESIASKDWGVFIKPKLPKSQEKEAARHAACLQYFYDHVVATDAFDRNERGGKERLIKHVMRADSYYYCAQHFAWKPEPGKTVDVDGADAVPVISAEVEYVPLWYFENTSGTLRFLPFGGFGITGEEMDFDGEWMVTVGRGVMFAACIAYMFKRLTFQDWTIYNERYAQNKVVGMTTASEESPQGQAMADVVSKFNSDMGLVFYECAATDKPPIQLLGPQGTTSVELFEKFLQRQDSKMTVMYRGSDLSMMSRGGKGEKPTGASLQGDETERMETACCRMVQGSLGYYVDRQVIKYCFGEGVEPLAYFGLPDMDVEDAASIRDSAGFLADRGVKVNAASVADRLGIEVAGDGEDALAPIGQATGDPDAQTQEATTDVRDALKDDFSANSAFKRAALNVLDKIDAGLRTANAFHADQPRDEAGRFASLPLVSIPDEGWTGSRKEMSDRANKVMLGFNTESHPKLGNIHFTAQGRGETLHRQHTAHEFQAVQALPQIARQGKWTKSEPDLKGRQDVKAFHTVESRLRIGSTPYHAQMIVKESKDGTAMSHKFYLHRIK
ncbi:MAG TPA: DUF935 family protein [Chthoniobacteraceae bacterium]|jgi:hypothetical protein|nr:DUF935 family protein [Chthoniobacteraceae bacterium]